VRGGYVRSLDGTRISYVTRGEGPVIVGIHGGLGTALSLMPLTEHLADDYSVVLLNCRGHGTSEWGRSEPHIDRYVEDIRAVIDAVGPIDALFGYSFGAIIALETALATPDFVPRLVVYEPPLPVTYPMPDGTWLEAMLNEGRYEQLILEALAAGGGGLSSAELAAARDNPFWLSNVAHAPTLLPTMQTLSQLPPTVEQYASITAPTTLALGSDSATHIRRAGELLSAAVSGISVMQLAGQGHHFDPRALATVLADAARR
jgi:pimeloyl-ACP methyl ester carboxylesterase